MKSSELRMLVARYRDLKRRRKSNDNRIESRIREIQQRYLHETGQPIDAASD